ncbi:MAG: hypothetical protein HRT38_14810 [Alteromonadaceae bacterium]|nr:hypothetical protein [Alteromonadaceae bacterium]
MNKNALEKKLAPHKTLILCLSFAVLGMNTATANEAQKTTSFGAPQKEITEQIRKNYVEQNKSTVLVDQILGKASGKTRTEILRLKKEQDKTISATANSSVTRAARIGHHEFSIFDANSYLLNDNDFDGFYQTFSVTFDADVYNYNGSEFVDVYAELYLSKNGGEWLHYFTTDDFIIYSDSSTDDYEVITTLYNGYSSDHYDVLIDLYEVGYSNPVATISSDDTNALFALPLESVNYDHYEEERHSYSSGHGGSLSFIGLTALLLVGFRRYLIS